MTFIQIKNIFYQAPLIIFETKFQFFYRLFDAANNYILNSDDKVGEIEKLLIETINAAEIILIEMLHSIPHYKS